MLNAFFGSGVKFFRCLKSLFFIPLSLGLFFFGMRIYLDIVSGCANVYRKRLVNYIHIQRISMSPQATRQEQLKQLFGQQKCWMIADLSQSLDCSVITVRRLLKQLGYFSSFTHNSKWYALYSVPAFNKEGLWFCDGIGFSKHGNLKKTLLHLIDKSPQGLSAMQLADKLSVPCHAVLNQMRKDGVVDRFKNTGSFVYLSPDEEKKERQLARIRSLQGVDLEARESEPLSVQAAVYVLVEFIKSPQASFVELSKAVAKKQIIAEPEAIAQFFEKHGLKKKLLQGN